MANWHLLVFAQVSVSVQQSLVVWSVLRFCLYELHKLIPTFQFASQFSLIRRTSPHKQINIRDASAWFVSTSCISYQVQTVTADLYGLCRSSSITASLIVLIAWFWCFLFSVLITLHWFNLKKVLCILFIIRSRANFYEFYEQLYWFNCCLCNW